MRVDTPIFVSIRLLSDIHLLCFCAFVAVRAVGGKATRSEKWGRAGGGLGKVGGSFRGGQGSSRGYGDGLRCEGLFGFFLGFFCIVIGIFVRWIELSLISDVVNQFIINYFIWLLTDLSILLSPSFPPFL